MQYGPRGDCFAAVTRKQRIPADNNAAARFMPAGSWYVVPSKITGTRLALGYRILKDESLLTEHLQIGC